MRKVAIIGAGQAGLLAAHGLLARGYAVTVYSERTPDEFLTKARPTGSAARFATALQWERDLGLAHWEDRAPLIQGANLQLCPGEPDNRAMTLVGRLAKPGAAIDLRLQSHRWLLDVEARGGRLEIESVSPERLDAIAAAHDLTVVAGGRGALQALFARDPGKSSWDRPARRLAMVNVGGIPIRRPECAFTAIKFIIVPRYGECIWVPWLHMSGEAGWSLLIEAKEGGRFDIFQQAQSGSELLALVKGLVSREFAWDSAWLKRAELLDENAWLVGSFVPTVRQPVARLPGGSVAMALGDTLHTLDPLSGQGANNGNKMARHLVDRIVARGDQPFDAAWMTETFELFWARHQATEALTNLLLRPMRRPGKELLVAAFGSTGTRDDHSGVQRLANAFCDGFNDPQEIVPALQDVAQAHRLIENCTGKAWPRAVAAGLLKVALGQVRDRLGFSTGHPGTYALDPGQLDPA